MGLAFLVSIAVSVSTGAQPAGTKGSATTSKGAGTASTTTAATAGAGAANAASPSKGSDAGASVGTTAAAGDAGAGIAAGASSPSTTPVAPGGVDGATYAVRLRDLESRVDELKDQIRRSHTRLALLSDTIMSGGAAGSRAEVTFHNEMSSAFKLTKALIVLDGAVQYNRSDETGALADQKEIPVFAGSVPPGDHTVSILLNFQGNGYGVFTYLRGYKFEVKSSHSFTSVEGKTMSVIATALEKGGVTTPLEQRPAVEWHERVQALGAPPPTAGAGVAAPPATGGASSGASGSIGNGAAQGSGSLQVGGGKK